MKKNLKSALIFAVTIGALLLFTFAASAFTVKLSLSAKNDVEGIRLEWSEHEDVYYYEIYRYTEKKNSKQLLSKVQENYYIDADAAEGKTYSYTVVPVFTDYSTGAESDSVTIYRLASVKITQVSSERNGLELKFTGVKNAKGYRVYRKLKDEQEWLTVGKLKSGARSFTDEAINPGQTYVYCVKAFVGEYESAAANEKELYYISYPEVKGISNSKNGIVLEWEQEDEAEYYAVYKKTGESGGFTFCALLDKTYTEYEDKAVVSGQSYHYYVCSANAEGNISSYDKVLSIKSVKESVITAAVCVKNGIKLVWSRSEGCQGYAIFKRAYGEKDWKLRGVVYGENKLFAVDSKVENKKLYTYTVRAFSGKIRAPYDDEGVTMRFYEAPEKLKCTTDAKQGNSITWKEQKDVKGYAVYRKQAKTDWQFIGFSKENSFVDKTAKSKTVYSYGVKAYESSVLHSAMSDSVTTKK